jgi:hypothetical protein
LGGCFDEGKPVDPHQSTDAEEAGYLITTRCSVATVGSAPNPATPLRDRYKLDSIVGLLISFTRVRRLAFFTATQLIAAGVDVRTVAGRLGHSVPSLTLKVYSHFD